MRKEAVFPWPGHWSTRVIKGLNIQKALIPLHFGNPEQHNKLLALGHPTMG
jgi:hypothetical protein